MSKARNISKTKYDLTVVSECHKFLKKYSKGKILNDDIKTEKTPEGYYDVQQDSDEYLLTQMRITLGEKDFNYHQTLAKELKARNIPWNELDQDVIDECKKNVWNKLTKEDQEAYKFLMEM